MSLQGRWLLFKTRHSQLKQQVQGAILHPTRKNAVMAPEAFPPDLVVKERQVFGARILTISTGDPQARHLVFFHGGAYAMQGVEGHRTFIVNLVRMANVTVSYLDYPLTPEADANQTVVFALSAWEYLKAQYPADTFTFVGDSAGGGLALVVLQQSRDHNLPLPAGTVLISPWSDLSMMNPDLVAADARDPFLTLSTLKQVGYQYAGDLPVTDPLVSPLYGDFSHLGPILMYYGTDEVLTPDHQRLVARLHGSTGTTLKVVVWPHLLHDYVLWSKLPETKRTLTDIKRFVLNNDRLEA